MLYAGQNFKWRRLSGKWKISESELSENRAWTSPWNYYELININSLVTEHPLDNYSKINFDLKIHDRYESPAEFYISFSVRSPNRFWLYHLYAFKLSGGFWGINKVSFIHSDRKDKTKRVNTKRNTFIKELASKKFRLRYGKKYKAKIKFSGNKVTLYIDGERVLTGKMPSEDHSGRIAISTKNTKVSIDRIEVKDGNKIVFEDDFDTDSIYVRRIKARVERVPKTKPEK